MAALMYLSHAIADGGTLNTEERAENRRKAYKFAGWLRDKFPQIRFFCPAEMEVFVAKALKGEYLTLDQVLNVDCEIIKECEGLIAYTPKGKTSKGMDIEIEFANANNVPVQNLYYADDMKEEALIEIIGSFIEECIDG